MTLPFDTLTLEGSTITQPPRIIRDEILMYIYRTPLLDIAQLIGDKIRSSWAVQPRTKLACTEYCRERKYDWIEIRYIIIIFN